MKKVKFYLRAIHYILMRWIVHKSYMTAYLPEHNLRFKFKTEDAMGRVLYKYHQFEPGITQCFLNNIPLDEEDIVLDVGANIGWYSLLLDKYSPSSVRLYAFEPDPLNFQLLTTNVALNKAPKIVSVPKALSDQNTTQTLYLYPSKNRGRHSLLPINSGDRVEVTTTTVDTFIQENQLDVRRIKFMKIDVEGYEYFVLRGAHEVLSHIPYVHTEYSPGYMQRGGVDAQGFIDLMRSYQFISYGIEAEGKLRELTDEQLLALEKGSNILWTKEKLPTSQ